MNSTWSFYNPETGLFEGKTFTGPERYLVQNTPEGCAAIEGIYDHVCCKIDLQTNEVVEHQPPQPSENHYWTGKRWELTEQFLETENARQATKAKLILLETRAHRAVRDFLLAMDEPTDTNRVMAKGRIQNLQSEMQTLRDDFELTFKQRL